MNAKQEFFFPNTQSFIASVEFFIMTFTRTSNCKDIHKHATFLQKKEQKKKSSKVEEQINSKMVNIELVNDQLITINTIWAQ